MKCLSWSLILSLLLLLTGCESSLNVTGIAKPSSSKIVRISPSVAQAGSSVRVFGKGFTRSMSLTIGGMKIPMTAEDSRRAVFILPSGLSDGLVTLNFAFDDTTSDSINLVQGPAHLNLIVSELPATQICKGQLFKDQNGLIQTGEQECDSDALLSTDKECSSDGETNCIASSEFPAVDLKQDIQNNLTAIHSSVKIAALSGGMVDCTENSSNCFIASSNANSQSLKAVNANLILSTSIKTGTTLAGVLGTVVPKAADCSLSGELGCVATSNFPAANKAAISDINLLSGVNLLGMSGTISSCSANASACFVPNYVVSTQPLKAIDVTPLTADVIQSGSTLAGVLGTLSLSPANCASDGGTACVTVASFPSANKAVLSANKLRSGLTLANVVGTQADCSSDGTVGCFALSAYPAVQKSLITAGKIRSGLSIGGVPGSLANCAADGSNCFIPNYVLTSQPLKAIDYSTVLAANIKTGSSIAGVAGTLAPKPGNCASENETGCVATAAYPAVDKSILDAQKANIHSSLTIAGTAGTMPSCTANAELSCFATGAFPAMDKAPVVAAAAKFSTGINLGGVAGTLNACAIDAASSCLTVTNFPAINKSNFDNNKSKVLPSFSFVGVTGTLLDCLANGSDCHLGTYAAVSQKFKAINFDNISATNLKAGTSVAGISGTMVPKPADCSTDAGTACVTVTNYPAVDKSALTSNKSMLHSSLTAGGVSGTLSDCASDGQVSCLSVVNYPSISKTSVQANVASIRSGLYLGGVQGTMGGCAANGSDCYIPPFVLSTQPLKAVDYTSLAANLIRNGTSISNITGNLVQAPADCSSDNQAGCVAISNFPAANKSNVTTNASKIHSSLTIAGVTGSMNDCAADGVAGCLAVTNYPAIQVSAVTAAQAKIHNSITLGGVAGTMNSCTDPNSNCMIATYALSTQPLKAINADGIVASVIKSGTVIAGVTGNVTATPGNCSANGGTNCVTIAGYPAMDRVTIDAAKAKIATGTNVGGVVGTLANCSTDGGTSCLSTSSWPSYNKTLVDSSLSKIKPGITINGTAGQMTDCSTNGSNCYVVTYASGTQNKKAINFDSIVPSVIKNGTSIAGVSGLYPSATYPMGTGDAYADLDDLTYNTQMNSATTFGWFDRNGARQTHAGDADITTDNIKTGTTIYGINGSIFASFNSWDVRVGKTIPSGTGKLKATCRNHTRIENWDISLGRTAYMRDATNKIELVAHGFANNQMLRIGYANGVSGGLSDLTNYYVVNPGTDDFQLATTSGGTALDLTANGNVVPYRIFDGIASIYDTMDYYNNNGVTPTGNPWGSADLVCGGMEATTDDSNNWKDVTTGGCASSSTCRYMDKITKTQWTKQLGHGSQGSAIARCNDLIYDGFSDWRLPTMAEFITAATHNIASAAGSNWNVKADLSYPAWSATKVSNASGYGWAVYPIVGEAFGTFISSNDRNVICVRND